MKKISLRSGLMATTTICGAVLSTMAGGALLATVATMLPATAQAQDYTSGALIGTVTDNAGKPVAGATVTLTSVAQGQARTLTTAADGSFHATGLPSGEYTVAVSANGYTNYNDTVSVVISQEVRYSFAMQTVGVDTQTVVVKGKRVRQDFTKTTTGLTVDLETLTSQQPIARNLTAVTLLAPTVSRGNPGFGNVASFGGGSVAENAYYIDGLNITNPDTYVGSASVPFDFYKTIEVKTGGYAAEFGRATGGVVNATTKSGTNQFMFAVHGNYQPSDLRADQLDTYSGRGKFTEVQNNSLGIEMGGPIIKDHLFAYGLYQINDAVTKTAGYRSGNYTVLSNKDPFMGVKLDGYITPTQHFSFTAFDTTNTDVSNIYGFTDTTDAAATIGCYTLAAGSAVTTPRPSGIPGCTATNTRASQANADFALNPTVAHTMRIGNKKGYSLNELGGRSYVFNYNGKVTDWFTVSAAVGDMQDRNNVVPIDKTSYYVVNANAGNAILSLNQPAASYSQDMTERKFYRFDGDLRFELLGRHHVRFGYDNEENSMTKTTDLTGAQPVRYTYTSVGGADVVQIIYEHLGGNVTAKNSAEYIQDSWDVTPTLNLQLGLRNDDFAQSNLSGEQYLDLTNNVGLRLGASWDPTGEGNWKVFGSYGQNFIPPAMNLGYRGKDLYFFEYFNAPAGGFVKDPTTGLPTALGTPHPDPATNYSSPCPTVAGISGAPAMSAYVPGALACQVNGNGAQEGANSKAELDLKATREDEIILGTTYRVNDLWSLDLTYTNRTLQRVSEDSDFGEAIINYLDAHGLDSSQYTDGTISNSYYVWNVGDHDATIRLKLPLPGETQQRIITLSAADLGHYHDPKREYDALVFGFRRAFDGKWSLQGSYTWSKSYGNYEGTVKSDVGNSQQTDAGATIAFDSPGFEDYGTGLLPNNHTHSFKAWGSYSITSNFLVGANVVIESPTQFGCLGVHPTDPYAAGYGAYSHYCGGVPAQQGKGLKADWTKNVDISARYTVPDAYAIGGKLILRADIFNLFNTHQVTTRRVAYETTGAGTTRDYTYGQPTNYNAPRYVRLGFDLSY